MIEFKDVRDWILTKCTSEDLEKLQLTVSSLEEQKKAVRFLDLAQKEQKLLLALAKEKEQLSQAVLDTIIQRVI